MHIAYFYCTKYIIAQAMCTNVKELLLYYRSALQRILNRYEFHGLLSLFKKVRPLAHLIVEVARLCGCSRESQCTLASGSRILTHIYKEVTKVTNPKIALVFYSILKSCCEVYFRQENIFISYFFTKSIKKIICQISLVYFVF